MRAELFSFNIPGWPTPDITSPAVLLATADYLRDLPGVSIVRGKRVATAGLLDTTMDPDDHVVDVEASPGGAFIGRGAQVPLRVNGANSRWSFGLWQLAGYCLGHYTNCSGVYAPLAVDPQSGSVYLPLYANRVPLTHVVLGHPVEADQGGSELFIQVTRINNNPESQWHVHLNNPTKAPITTTLRQRLPLPGLQIGAKKVTVPPGALVLPQEV